MYFMLNSSKLIQSDGVRHRVRGFKHQKIHISFHFEKYYEKSKGKEMRL